MSNTKIVLNRQSDLILDNAQITKPTGIVLGDITGATAAITSINTATSLDMSAEASIRLAGDASIASNLSTEIVDRATAVSAEASSRVSGDASLAAKISTDLSTTNDSLEGLGIYIEGALSTEVANREADVDAEESRAIVAETSLQNNIDAEASLRVVGDESVAAAMSVADASINTALSVEISRATSVETSLNTKVDYVISNTDPVALDSLTEIVSAFQSMDGDLDGAITSLATAANASLSVEASTRLAADNSIAGELSSEIADREGAVSLEEAARISGDSSVAAKLSTEVANREAAVSAEASRATAAEGSLATAMAAADSAEASIRLAAEGSIAAGLSSELVARVSADASIADAKLDLAGGTMTGDINMGNRNINNVSDLTATNVFVNDSLFMNGQWIKTDRPDGTIGFSVTAINIGEASIFNVPTPINSSDAANKSYVDSADTSIAAGLSSELVARASAITSEASSRVAGDASLSTAMSTADASLAAEITALPETDGTTIIVDAADNLIKLKDIVASGSAGTRTFEGLINVAAQPASLAGFGDLTLVTKAYVSGQVSTEASTRVAGDASIAANLSTELVARASADTAEASTRLAADNSIAADLSSELVARASADASIAANLSSELVARASADTAEASDRVAGDLSLQNQIDFITNNIDAAAIDSLTEIVSAFQSADGDINGAITALASTASSGLSTEVAARESADNSIAANLSTEIVDRAAAVSTETSARVSGDASIAANLSTEIVDRAAAVSTEESARISADASLAADLSSEISGLADVDGATIILDIATNTIKLKQEIAAPASGMYTFNSNVEVSDVLTVGGVDVMNAISSEVSARIAGDESLAEELSTEVAYLIANTDLTSIDSFSEVVADLSSEVSRAESVEGSLELLIGDAVANEVLRAESAELSLANTYFRKATYTGAINGSNAVFAINQTILAGSEAVYLNGLLMEAGDYSLAGGNITFNNAPHSGDKVVVYGVYFS